LNDEDGDEVEGREKEEDDGREDELELDFAYTGGATNSRTNRSARIAVKLRLII
jgi:hypothetical protein